MSIILNAYEKSLISSVYSPIKDHYFREFAIQYQLMRSEQYDLTNTNEISNSYPRKYMYIKLGPWALRIQTCKSVNPILRRDLNILNSPRKLRFTNSNCPFQLLGSNGGTLMAPGWWNWSRTDLYTLQHYYVSYEAGWGNQYWRSIEINPPPYALCEESHCEFPVKAPC